MSKRRKRPPGTVSERVQARISGARLEDRRRLIRRVLRWAK